MIIIKFVFNICVMRRPLSNEFICFCNCRNTATISSTATCRTPTSAGCTNWVYRPWNTSKPSTWRRTTASPAPSSSPRCVSTHFISTLTNLIDSFGMLQWRIDLVEVEPEPRSTLLFCCCCCCCWVVEHWKTFRYLVVVGGRRWIQLAGFFTSFFLFDY